MKYPPLRADDGATFVGSIDATPEGAFEASYRLELDVPGATLVQPGGVQRSFPTRDGARGWLHAIAAYQGYEAIRFYQ